MLALAAMLLAMSPDDFAERLWRALPHASGNEVVSSTSLQACLGLLIPAVGNASKPALAKTLGVAPAALPKRDQALRARLRSLVEGGEATVSNAAFFAEPPTPAYVAAVAKGYGATSERLLRGSAGLQQVNGWAAQRTKGRIPHLLDSLSPAAVLVNAVTFDGLWQTPFPAEGTCRAAFAAPGGSRPVDTMRIGAGTFGYAKGTGFQALAMPYQGGRYRMVILLPDAGDPAPLLGTAAWTKLGMAATTVDLTLPRFTVRSAPNVKQALASLGLAPLFSTIDLRPAVPSGAVKRIDDVVQKTFIEVGERGTKAAAASGIVMSRAAMRPVQAIPFHVDRPFAFVLQHLGTGEPLFEGVVREP